MKNFRFSGKTKSLTSSANRYLIGQDDKRDLIFILQAMSCPIPHDQNDLATRRARISQIDAGILALLDERMRLAIEIAQIKKQTGKDIEDLERETHLLGEILKHNRDTILEDNRVAEIWSSIFKLSKDIQEEATNTKD